MSLADDIRIAQRFAAEVGTVLDRESQALRNHPYWRDFFERLPKRKSRRPRLEAAPDSPQLEYARQARTMRAEHPDWGNERIVYEIYLVQAHPDWDKSSVTDAKITTAAIRRLQRWEKRLRELGE